jgi:hypothetical protein
VHCGSQTHRQPHHASKGARGSHLKTVSVCTCGRIGIRPRWSRQRQRRRNRPVADRADPSGPMLHWGTQLSRGEMAEWFKAHAWKACVRETVPWVRIPLSPPDQRIAHRQPAGHVVGSACASRSRGWPSTAQASTSPHTRLTSLTSRHMSCLQNLSTRHDSLRRHGRPSPPDKRGTRQQTGSTPADPCTCPLVVTRMWRR